MTFINLPIFGIWTKKLIPAENNLRYLEKEPEEKINCHSCDDEDAIFLDEAADSHHDARWKRQRRHLVKQALELRHNKTKDNRHNDNDQG